MFSIMFHDIETNKNVIMTYLSGLALFSRSFSYKSCKCFFHMKCNLLSNSVTFSLTPSQYQWTALRHVFTGICLESDLLSKRVKKTTKAREGPQYTLYLTIYDELSKGQGRNIMHTCTCIPYHKKVFSKP